MLSDQIVRWWARRHNQPFIDKAEWQRRKQDALRHWPTRLTHALLIGIAVVQLGAQAPIWSDGLLGFELVLGWVIIMAPFDAMMNFLAIRRSN